MLVHLSTSRGFQRVPLEPFLVGSAASGQHTLTVPTPRKALPDFAFLTFCIFLPSSFCLLVALFSRVAGQVGSQRKPAGFPAGGQGLAVAHHLLISARSHRWGEAVKRVSEFTMM